MKHEVYQALHELYMMLYDLNFLSAFVISRFTYKT